MGLIRGTQKLLGEMRAGQASPMGDGCLKSGVTRSCNRSAVPPGKVMKGRRDLRVMREIPANFAKLRNSHNLQPNQDVA